MPTSANAVTISGSESMVRSSSGKRRTAMGSPQHQWSENQMKLPKPRSEPSITSSRIARQPPPLHLEQEFEGLQVAACLGHRFSPSIKPMPAQQNPMCARMLLQRLGQLSSQLSVVLRVLEDRHPFQICVRRNACQPLQQLIAFQGHVSRRRKLPRKQSVPN